MNAASRTALRWLLVIAYAAAGCLHLARPAPFLAIIPPWVPEPELVIAATGVAELAGAAGLMLPATRKVAGWGLAFYALCVWPANFHHALAHIAIGGETLGWWYHGPRLAAQPLIIWWALWASGAVDWPFGRRQS
ncbi:putative membrane protein [Sphingopyxis panaciterrae]|uniref:DoxX family protein n=1 Tax=Sphingopyxis panaciterrae TaxID=363841 RepID=UPI0024452CF6|nr:DoxX family protein [Sphingopyxis panaciterrae]NIJ39178.1 putative membrane protein [Sphingopyxis panaciterrae]